MRGIFVTGPPGSGKTTLVKEMASLLASLGCRVEGVYAPERRSGGRRVGFDICTLDDLTCWRLARLGCESSVRVGRYGVCVGEAEEAASYLLGAAGDADIIVIDEIGPMELRVPGLRRAIEEIVRSSRPLLAVIHRRLRHSEPGLYKALEAMGPVLVLTPETRDAIRRRAIALARVLAREACGDEGREDSAEAT